MGERQYERVEGSGVGQYVGYRFFHLDPAWRRLPIDERAAGKDAFAEVVDEFAGRMGVDRSTFVIGADGNVAKVFRKVKPDEHADQVLEALRAGS